MRISATRGASGLHWAILTAKLRGACSLATAIEQINQAVALVVPQIILLATVCVMFLTGPFLVSEAGRTGAGLRHRWGALSLLALGVASYAWLHTGVRPVGTGPF